MINMPIEIEGEPAFNMKEAAEYLNISRTALNNRINRLKVRRYESVGREKYVKKSDLDRMREIKPIEDEKD